MKFFCVQGRFWIIDFNPFTESTDPLLFSWKELSGGNMSAYSASVDIINGWWRCIACQVVTIGLYYNYPPVYLTKMRPILNLSFNASNSILDGRVIGQFRFADEDTLMQPNQYLSSRIPVDFVDLSTGSDATKLVDFMRMVSFKTSVVVFHY